MPSRERHKTKYVGVYWVLGRDSRGRPEKAFYITYRKDGKVIEEKAGWQRRNDMTAAKASLARAAKIEGKDVSNIEKRKKARQRANLAVLWKEYEENSTAKSIATDRSRFNRHLASCIGHKEPGRLQPLDLERVRVEMTKAGLSAQTVKHVLALVVRLVRFGVDRGRCGPIPFKVKLPKVENERTEDLTPAQLRALLSALDDSPTSAMLRLALYTGMRRGEILRLTWQDIDFRRRFIHIRSPKGGRDMTIPMNEAAHEVLKDVPREGTRLFPVPVRTVADRAKRILQRAGLPGDFRPFHGLRHTYASALASSGKVDIYTLQRLMTHKSPRMTQRYAHLRDDALRKAAEVAGEIFRKEG